MAHMIDMSNDRANMAYVGEKPWHDLGNELTSGASFDEWKIAAGMEWTIAHAPLQFVNMDGSAIVVPDKKALYRSDNGVYLSTVGKSFKVVHPGEVLEFFRDLTESQGYTLETAGCLYDGQKFWAMARTGMGMRLKGTDLVNGFLLLSTSCDGTMATTAKFTSVRVVCQNTLTMSLNDRSNASVRVKHKTEFNPEQVKMQLGLEIWSEFSETVEQLADTGFDRKDKASMKDFLVSVFQGDMAKELDDQPNKRGMVATFNALINSPGSDLASAKNTAWGAINAVTHYVDHQLPTRGDNATVNRFVSSQWGNGEKLKQRAWDYFSDKIAA